MNMRTFARLLTPFLLAIALTNGAEDRGPSGVFNRLAENWRWSKYWFGKTGIDDVYVEGKGITTLLFWAKDQARNLRGMCSPELGLCVAYSGAYLDPSGRRTEIPPNVTPQVSFAAFVKSGFHDSSHILDIRGFNVADFESALKSVTLPPLGPPSSIFHRERPEEFHREAEKIKRTFLCESPGKRHRKCSGSLTFAYCGSLDPYWFVLRDCSAECEFRGEAIEMLKRADNGWEITSGGLISSPQAEVKRLRRQVKKAQMLRLRL